MCDRDDREKKSKNDKKSTSCQIKIYCFIFHIFTNINKNTQQNPSFLTLQTKRKSLGNAGKHSKKKEQT